MIHRAALFRVNTGNRDKLNKEEKRAIRSQAWENEQLLQARETVILLPREEKLQENCSPFNCQTQENVQSVSSAGKIT